MPDDTSRGGAHLVTDRETIREIVGEPLPIAATKEMPALDEYCRRFIAMSPFLVMATVGGDGHVDVSPRGDPPGQFVKIVDDKTLIIPDRQGNQRVDSMLNLLDNPHVGIIFFLPGVAETLRIRGRASVTRDAVLLADMAVNGKPPKLGFLIDIDEVFFQCAKALIRSKLWHPETPIDRREFPSMGQIARDQRRPDASVEEIEALIQKEYREKLY